MNHRSVPASHQSLQQGARIAHAPAGQKPKLLDQVRDAIRVRHYSMRMEEAYVSWIKRFILFHGKRHPLEMGENEITQFLSALAVHEHVSASTQNQALCALLFLYRHVLDQHMGWLEDVVRAKRPQRLPVVLSRQEVKGLLETLEGVHWIMASLLYGAGLRLLECLRLRVKDIDFSSHQIVVHEGKGNKDRDRFPHPLPIAPRSLAGCPPSSLVTRIAIQPGPRAKPRPRTIAGPAILVRPLHHPRPDGIELHVPPTGQPIGLRLDRTRLIPPFPQRPASPIPRVDVARLRRTERQPASCGLAG
ncbi:MAG: phage integrase N-terminal SAM-like domain-containing protein [Candidatus Entotheonellia bacterium]